LNESGVIVVEINRRAFFSGQWLKAALKTPVAVVGERDDAIANEPAEYFSSLETCYAFLSEVPLEDLQNEAVKRGLGFERLSKIELARLLFSAGQYRS
jgi:hypothetical protein